MNRNILVPVVFSLFFSIAILGTTTAIDEATSFCGYKEQEEFSFMGHAYGHKDMTYTISKYSSKLSHSDVDYILAKAFEAWSNVTDLTFTRKHKNKKGSSVDIDVRFEIGPHGNDEPFDGNVLAHAGYGIVHFDESENWSNRLDSGVVNLYAIAVHEIGHTLGLHHSSFRKSIMYASYNPYDVGIQYLYGPKTTRHEEEKSSQIVSLKNVQNRKCILHREALTCMTLLHTSSFR